MSTSKPYSIDLWKNKPITIEVKQSDSSRRLKVVLLENKEPYNLTGKIVRYYVNKVSGNKIFNDCTITNATTGEVLVPLTDQALSEPGTNQMEIAIFEGEKIETTFTVYLQVSETIVNSEAIESSNEFGSLQNALGEVNAWNGKFDDEFNKFEEKYNGLEQEYATELTGVKLSLDSITNRFEEFNIRDYCTKNENGSYTILSSILTLSDKNGKLKVPSGNYYCNLEVIFNGSMVVEGDGYSSLIISTLNGIDKYLFKFNNQNAKHCMVKDLFISGNTGSLANSGAIYTCNNAWFRLDNVRIDGFVGDGITFENVYLGNIINCHIMGCNYGVNIKPFASITIMNTEITYNKVGIYDIGGGVTRIIGGYIEQNGQSTPDTDTTLRGGVYKKTGTFYMAGMYVEDNGGYSRRDTNKISKNGNMFAFYDFDIFLEDMNGSCVIDGISTNLNPGGIHLKNSSNCDFKNIKAHTKGYRSLMSPIMWADENSFDNKLDYVPSFEDGNRAFPFLILGNKFKNKNEFINGDNLITTNNTNKISPYKPIAKSGYVSEWTATADKTSTSAPSYGYGVGTYWVHSTAGIKLGYVTGLNSNDTHSLKFLCKCKTNSGLKPIFNNDTFDLGLFGNGENVVCVQFDFFGSTPTKIGLALDIASSTGDTPVFYNVQYCKNLYNNNFSYVIE